MNLLRLVVVSCVSLVLAAAASASVVTYSVIDLGLGVNPRAINKHGEVAVVVFPVPANSSVTRPGVWRDGVITDLTDTGWRGGLAFAINASGTVVGRAQLIGGSSQVPFLWSGGSTQLIDVGVPAQFTAIADSGVIGGSYFAQDVPGGPFFAHPFLYDAGAVIPLPTTGSGTLSAINTAGVIAGNMSGKPVIWDAAHMYTVLPLLGGGGGTVSSVNDAGIAVGNSTTGRAINATQFETRPVLWTNGIVQDLGSFGGSFGGATGINNANQIVGFSNLASEQGHAFLIDSDGITDLNARVDSALGWSLLGATGINDDGWIIGTALPAGGTQQSDLHGVLLVPLTAADMLERLAEAVTALDAQIANALRSKLNAAAAALSRGDATAACNTIAAFVNEVRAQTGKKISSETAGDLIENAQAVQKRCGC